MTTLKLSKSGLQLQIIDDFGNVYGIARSAVQNLLDNKVRTGFSVATRLPFRVSIDRFGPSPLWDPDGVSTGLMLPDSSISLNNDALSAKSLKKGEDTKKFEDKEVW